MPIKYGQYEFAGPFSTFDELEDAPGVFILLCFKDNEFNILRFDAAKKIRTEVEMVLLEPGLSDMCGGKLRVAVYDTVDEEQMALIQQQLQNC
ncbi:MAG: hypothetical protein C0473_02730 [Cyanobacteria bacterium DS3.002]|nr:hypothetical protein [Cyanobacteria bacterium DS3.002]MBA4049731.1 hypothetical protein [Cyanobacteria bacterium DS2.008]MBA4073416.1 hypothetical protein [Cyanobacteria bacterium PR.023]